MNIQKNVNLAKFTTFHIGGPAKFFCSTSDVEELEQAIAWAKGHNEPIFILGGGSNMLVSDAGFAGLVIHFAPKGLEVVQENEYQVILKIFAGEVWDEVVKFTVDQNWWGIENLSHVPGLVGGFAVQNVGAYGQEAGDVISEVTVYDTHEQVTKTFNKSQCQFTYRKSIFNTEAKGRYVIIAVTIALSKQPQPNLSYGDVSRYFANLSINEPTQPQIRQAIIEIRDRKFPFPKEAKNGNAGSFFRGPILTAEQIEYLFQKVATNFGTESLARLNSMTDRLMVAQGMKTPTAFLIELCGLKGLRIGGAQVHQNHAAIVLNATGEATAADVLALFTRVGREVYRRTGVMLHIEPELIGFTEAEKEQILDSVLGNGII
jgi:UDP-N-acetylmuramate dehydrogenase